MVDYTSYGSVTRNRSSGLGSDTDTDSESDSSNDDRSNSNSSSHSQSSSSGRSTTGSASDRRSSRSASDIVSSFDRNNSTAESNRSDRSARNPFGGNSNKTNSSTTTSSRSSGRSTAGSASDRRSKKTDSEIIDEFDAHERANDSLAESVGSVTRDRADPLGPNAEQATEVFDEIDNSGGVLSETTEDGLRSTADSIDTSTSEFVETAGFENRDNVVVDDLFRAVGADRFADDVERSVSGFATGISRAGQDIVNLPRSVLSLERAAEIAEQTPDTVRQFGAGTVAGAGLYAGVNLAEDVGRRARENPAQTAGSVLTGVAAGFAAGRGVGIVGRAASDRVRTVGSTEIDIEDITNEQTADLYNRKDPDTGQSDDAFPGADDRELYETDPAEAVRQQADEYTPDVIDEKFSEADVEGTVLKKALEVEPDGPESNRVSNSGGGFETQAGAYENTGAFVGPELSPNFLRVGSGSTRLTPGIPDVFSRPTGVLAKTDVENPTAGTLDELNDELRAAEGDTTALTKPAAAVNPDEIEAVIPPGASFDPLSTGSQIRDTLRDFGIGSDFSTSIAGRRVPLRLVRPGDRDRRNGREDSGRGRRIDEISRRVRRPNDRPIYPLASIGGSRSQSDAAERDMLSSMIGERRPPGGERRPPGGERRPPGSERSPGPPPSFGPSGGPSGGPSAGPSGIPTPAIPTPRVPLDDDDGFEDELKLPTDVFEGVREVELAFNPQGGR